MLEDKKIILSILPDHNLNFLFDHKEEQGSDNGQRRDIHLGCA